MEQETDQKIAQEIRRLSAERGPEKSACPSEVARALDPGDWRDLMPRVREIAANLAEDGEIVVTRKGEVVDARRARGPVRISIATQPHGGS